MDALQEKIAEAFAAVCEAEELAYAAGLRTKVGLDLVTAHSALLRARSAYNAVTARYAA